MNVNVRYSVHVHEGYLEYTRLEYIKFIKFITYSVFINKG